jgi:hypothetical protein
LGYRIVPNPIVDTLARRSSLRTRSISAENPDGAPGGGGRADEGTGAVAASRLGHGWKISPSVDIQPGDTHVLADLDGPGVLEHLWLTTHRKFWRRSILRFYWDGSDQPAIEVPLGDFFCHGWTEFAQVSSQVVASNPNGGFNSYWPMPFHRHARITVENVSDEIQTLYFQVDLGMGDVPDDALYLHAQWRRTNPVPRGDVHELLDVTGGGHWAGCYVAWGTNSPNWWGEGEFKFYLDADTDYPTVCGTGTEDYFGGAWNFDVPGHGYTTFTTPYLGLSQVLRPDGLYTSQQRFGMYRWHVVDPIRFDERLRVTVQPLGIGPGQGNGQVHRYRQNPEDIASTSFAYLDRPNGFGGPAPELIAMEVE